MSLLNKYISKESADVLDENTVTENKREHVTTDAATRVPVKVRKPNEVNTDKPLGDDSISDAKIEAEGNKLENALEQFQTSLNVIESASTNKTIDLREVFPSMKPALEAHYVSLESDDDEDKNKDGFFMKIFKAIRDAIKWVWDKIVAVFKKIGEWLGLVKKSAVKKVEEAKDPEKVVVAKVNAEVQKEEVKKAQADKIPTDEEIQQLEKAAEESNAKTQEEFANQLAKAGNTTPEVIKEKLKPTTEAIKAATGVEPIDPKATPKEQVKQFKAVKKIAEKAKEAPVVNEESEEPMPVVVTKENINSLSVDVIKATKDKKQLEGKVKYKLSKKAVEFFKKVPSVSVEYFGEVHTIKNEFNTFVRKLFGPNNDGMTSLEAIIRYMSDPNSKMDEDTVVYNLIVIATAGVQIDNIDAKEIIISKDKKLTIDKIDKTEYTLADLSAEFLRSEVNKIRIKEIDNNTDAKISNEIVTTHADVTDHLDTMAAIIAKISNEDDNPVIIKHIRSLPDTYKKMTTMAEAAIKKNPNHPIAHMLTKAIQLGVQNAGMSSSMFLRYQREIAATYMEAVSAITDPKHFKLLGKA